MAFRDGAPGSAIAAAWRDAGATAVSVIDQLGVHVWRVPEHATDRALKGLSRNPHVALAEPDAIVQAAGEVTPNDPWWGHHPRRQRRRGVDEQRRRHRHDPGR